ncbi:MarR family transcriptional regulator [Leisingera sp. MMG026]|uniref:MarR family winged helix-turn-helix transcriptional regulator n=1 Tax=Leisingera sp. MMG026 TaxID=2909982 RepID=UPI001EFFC4D8|nr:MarR family transcriptional regulator [Leisingera sp. MMG026]MCF6432437.1 MarR family transcriptional regulator [Leisingera sp. MMG026]
MPTPDVPPPPVFEVLTEVGIINQLATAALEACLPDDLIAPHFAVLNHLIRIGDGQTPIEMARALQVPKTSFSNTLAGLEKRGLVEAHPNPKDRRSKTIWITTQGRRIREEIVSALGPVFRDLAQRAAPGTFHSLLPQLRELRGKMDALREE